MLHITRINKTNVGFPNSIQICRKHTHYGKAGIFLPELFIKAKPRIFNEEGRKRAQDWFRRNFKMAVDERDPSLMAALKQIVEVVEEHGEAYLLCFCEEGQFCHGEVIREYLGLVPEKVDI